MGVRTWFAVGLVALGLVMVGGVAQADMTMRCPSGRLVRLGDRLLELAQTCGAPDHLDRRTALREIAGRRSGSRNERERLVVEVRIEEWLYDLGPGRLLRRLVFENGRLAQIDTLGRGRR